MREIDLLVIGGGSAGMAAAIQAKKEGIDDILIVERDENLGVEQWHPPSYVLLTLI